MDRWRTAWGVFACFGGDGGGDDDDDDDLPNHTHTHTLSLSQNGSRNMSHTHTGQWRRASDQEGILSCFLLILRHPYT